MSSRARKKRKGRGESEENASAQADEADETDEAIGAKRLDSFLTYFFGIIVAAGAGAYVGVGLLDSWRVGLVCAGVGACVGFVMVRRGVEMF